MIEIKIARDDIDDLPLMRRVAMALLTLAGDQAPADISRFAATPAREKFAAGVPGSTIAPNDSPDVGAEAAYDPVTIVDDGTDCADPATVFADPAAVFGGASPVVADAAPAPVGEQGNVALTPPPVGTPPAPVNTPQTVGANTGLDTRGLPWDVRIHAGTKTTNKDGSWKKKPNVDLAVVAQVEAELRGVLALPAPGTYATEQANHVVAGNVAIGAPVTPPAPVSPSPAPVSAPGNVGIPTPPASPPTTGATGGPKITGFAQLLPAVTAGLTSGAITEAQVTAALARVGVQALPMIAPRTDLVLQVAAELFPGSV